MKPYYADDLVTIYHGSWTSIGARHFQEAEVVFADPPYNVGVDYGDAGDKLLPDEYREWCEGLLLTCEESAKSSVLITPGAGNLHMWMAEIRKPRWVMAWTKANGTGRNRIGKPDGFQKWEPILVYGRAKKCVPFDWLDIPILDDPVAYRHPCPKPLNLMRAIVAGFTEPGDTVLDPVCGSGTTLLAAKSLGRKAIGYEIEEQWCELAATRCRQEVLGLTA